MKSALRLLSSLLAHVTAVIGVSNMSKAVNPANTRVTVVGGGNAAQTLAALLPYKGFPTSLYCPFQDEAARIQAGIDEQGYMMARFAPHNSVKGDIQGKPTKISKEAKDVIPDADVIVLPLPSFAYADVLRDMKPYLKAGQKIAVTPGQGGFDWIAHEILGADLLNQLTIYAIMPMPFNCRIHDFGKRVDVQVYKDRYRVGCVPHSEEANIIALNGAMFGYTESCGSFLACTLYPINAIIHPARLYTLLADWKPGTTLAENPLFYEDMTPEGTALMDTVNKELIAIGDKLEQNGIPSRIPHIFDFLAKYVYKDPCSNLQDFFSKNDAYKGFRCPLKQQDNGEWAPDFGNRYFTEDIPLGLCIYKGVADLVGVATPAMDEIITWASRYMGKAYLEGGKLSGKDVVETNAPQKFGITSLDGLKKRYQE